MTTISRTIQLNEATAYVIRVRSLDALGNGSDWSEALIYGTPAGVSGDLNAPTGLVLVPAIRSVLLTWNASTNRSFSHYEIYVSGTSFGLTNPTAEYKYGDFFGTVANISKFYNGSAFVDMIAGNTYFIKMRAVSLGGVFSIFSNEISATTGHVGDADLVVNTISGNKITVNSLAADKITTGTLTAAVTITGILKTASGGSRVEIDSLGIRGYETDGTTKNLEYLTSDGSVTMRRAKLDGGAEILAPNTTNLDTDTSGWIQQTSATTWQFDTTSQSWTGTNATLAWESTLVYNPPGAVRVTSTSGTYEARSPTGSSGIVTTAGTRHRAILPVLALTDETTMTPAIRWYNGVTFLSEDTGPAVMTDQQEWRVGVVDAIAPATTTRASVSYKFSGGVSGDIHYIDEVAITAPANSTIARDTAIKRSGSGSLRIRASAAGVALAGTPDTGDGTGYPVTPGDWYYFTAYYRQGNGNFAFIVPVWLDNSGVPIKVGFDASRSVLDKPTTAFKLYSAIWQVPENATRLSVNVGHLAPSVATTTISDMHVDDISLTRAGAITTTVFQSAAQNTGVAQQVNGASSAGPGSFNQMSVFLRSVQSGFPYAEFNGHVFNRSVHARLTRSSGSQTIPAAAWTTVNLLTKLEAIGMDVGVSGGAYWIIIPRNGFYSMQAQVNWDDVFPGTTGGANAVSIERWSADGSTFIERVAASSQYITSAAYALQTSSCAMTARCNRTDRIIMRVWQGHGQSVDIIAGGGSVGVAHMLSVTYAGDAT